jgi:hypothetical protein
MAQFLHQWRPEEVVDVCTFAAYSQQQLGTAPAIGKDLKRLSGELAAFWEGNPQADWMTLVRTVAWVKAKKRRLANAGSVLRHVRFAYQDGFLPDLEPRRTDPEVERRIEQALQLETDHHWRMRLLCTDGMDNRRAALEQWSDQRARILV